MKLGKRPATIDHRDLLLETYRSRPSLPQAPVGFGHSDLVAGPWGMLANDRIGDCAIAGPAHETMLLNAAAGRAVRFTDDNIVNAYSAVTGYDPARTISDGSNPTDQGSAVRDVLRYRSTVGLTDADGNTHLIGAYVALTPGDWEQLLEALYVFECVGIGVELPDTAMRQFADGQPWDPVDGARVEGGHYIPVIGRPGEQLVDVVTWGRAQPMTEAFYRTYADEAWAYLSVEDLADGRTLEGFDMAALQQDLAAL